MCDGTYWRVSVCGVVSRGQNVNDGGWVCFGVGVDLVYCEERLSEC